MAQNLSLSSLLEESKKLTTHLVSSDIPTVQRGIDLLESESRKLVAKSVRNGRSLDPRAQQMLASSGVDTDELTENVGSVALLSAFELLQPSFDANVENFLAQHEEQSIINAIEETQLSTLDDFDKNLSANMLNCWEDCQKKLFEELGQYQGFVDGSSGFSLLDSGIAAAGDDSQGGMFDLTTGAGKVGQPRVERYAQVVRRLNDARVSATSRNASSVQFDLLGGLEKATIESSQELKSKQIRQAWKLIGHYTKVGNKQDTHELVKSACGYLEETFIDHVDRIIAQYPHDANVGGIPSIHRKIQGYLRVQFGRVGRQPAYLEVFNNEAIWAHMFMLYRCGYAQELLKYALDMEDIINDSDPGFVAHLKAFMDGNSIHRTDASVTSSSLEDPYKAALYKVVGRGNVPKKAGVEVTQTTEDYLWMHLATIRDSFKVASASHPSKSTLEELQATMLKFGPGHFDPNRNNPLLYFRVLLLCSLFENAIDYLLQVDRFQVEAVHMAITLAYYGLLRAPQPDSALGASSSNSGSFSGYLLAKDGQDAAEFDFARMIIHYSRALPDSSTQAASAAGDNAVHYLLLLTLPSLTKSDSARARQRHVCEQTLIRALYEKQEYAYYLGDVQSDGTKRPGMLEKYLPLLGIATHEQFSQTIIRRLADRSRDEGRLADCVLLYNLGDRYNTVLNVLCKQLGEVLFMRSTGATAMDSAGLNAAGSLSLDEIEGVSRAVLQHYKQREHIARGLDERAVATCNTLLSVIDFLNLHAQGAYEEALGVIEATQLVPLTGDVSLATQHAEKLRSLDDSITKNFSLILLTCMDTLSRLYAGLKESPFLDAVKQANMQQLRKKARGLMVFAGMIQFRMPSGTFAKLNRMDVFMN
ncbi:nuclear pore complex subunit [Dipsacomyces acuminosporus]|nr:nuclear pore complex subunit [Dipsacomyces acuminosporus]